MGIIFDKVNYKELFDVSFEIEESGIYSFIGNEHSIKYTIGSLIAGINKNKNVKIDKNVTVGYLSINPYEEFKNISVRQNLEKIMKKYKYKCNNIDKRIKEALKLVNLDEEVLDKIDNDLDYVSAKKVALACALICNPKVLVLTDCTECLNYNDRNDLLRLIRILKNRYNKIIILITKDTSFCYELGSNIYLVNESTIVKKGNHSILKNTSLLNRLNLRVPEIIKFTREYKKNSEELDDYNNILDLIKAIYRDIGYKR